MKGKLDYIHRRGLPGGPNEQFTYVTGVFSVDGYRNDSPDVNNPFNVIPSGRITMKEKDGQPLKKGPILGIDNLGNQQMMMPGGEYQFPGNQVFELPLKKEGGEPKNRKLKLRKGDYDPQNEAGYIQETPDVNVADPTIWGKYGRKYEENVSEEDFINRKKKQYLALHPGLTKKEGLTMDYFPANVEQNFRDAYDYNKHTAMVKGVSKEEGWNPKKRDTYVDDLNAQGTRIISDSKYGSKLKPNTWSRSLAGLQELGNTLVPGQPFKYNIPGLTKAEQKQMREDPTSALEIFAPATTLGQITANAAKNRGLSYGSDYKELPGALSGEFMPNVDDTDAMGMDPIQMALGIYSGAQLPLLAKQLPGLISKGAKSAANTAQEIYDAGTDIKGIYNAGKGNNLAFATAPEAQAARALQEAGLLGKNIDPKVLGRFPGLGQSVTRQALKNYNTTYRAVTPDLTNVSVNELMNMAKSGVTDFDDPVQVAQYMSTHIPTQEYGYRANPLTPGVGQDLLYTAKYPNAETAAEKLRQYGTHLTEVRPPMDFSRGDAKDWFNQYYTDKPFGIARSGEVISKFKNEGNWLTGYKPGTIAAKRDYTYLPYMGDKGQKILEPIRTIELKPKAIEEFGGELDKYQDGNETGEQENFLKNWFENRQMPTPEGQKLLEKVRPEAVQRASQNVPYVMTDQLPENVAGYYDTEDKNIYINKTYPADQINSTKQHEKVHYVQDGDKFYKVLDTPHQNLVEQNIKQPKEINTGNPEWDKNVKANYDDIVPQEEIHARIMTLRRLAGFKPDQVITEEMLNNYFNSVKQSGKTLDPDIEDLKAVTKGNSSIINLLNDMVSNPVKKQDTMYAQDGGEFSIYKDYMNGVYEGTDKEDMAKQTYDKLNRVYYKAAKDAGMSAPNYIMSTLLTL